MHLDLVYKLLEQLIEQRLLAQELVVVWHSGEPLVLPPSYYEEAIEGILLFCKTRLPELSVKFDFQTNATMINSTWCDLFEKYSNVVNIGVSCDGPMEFHNAFRIDWKGRGTYERTLNGMEQLESRGIQYNLIAVVSKKTLANPKHFFDFFLDKRNAVTDFHFNILASPINTKEELNYSEHDRAQYYEFYRELFEYWTKSDSVGESLPVRNFTQTLQRLASYGTPKAPDFLKLSSAPLRSLNMDTLGNITTFYAGLDISTEIHRYGDNQGLGLGNIKDVTLKEMLSSPKLQRIINDFKRCQTSCESDCDYYTVCPGGFELLQLSKSKGKIIETETTECVIHVKTLTDAVMDAIDSVGELDKSVG
tara:strand:+ start:234 stop:1325 length:1092 start_codon:yes stop_codon:yes gene_type:complete